MLEQLLCENASKQVREIGLRWAAYLIAHIDLWPFAGSSHLKTHCARVLRHALEIAEQRGHGADDLETLARAAVFHDSRRLDAWLDTGHGARAASYFEEHCREHGLAYDERAALIMRYHDLDDSTGRGAVRAWDSQQGINGESAHDVNDTALSPTEELYCIFKDADGLDRLRVSKQALDINQLRTPEGRSRIDEAQRMMQPIECIANVPAASEPDRWLVVVDVQKDFVTGALANPEAQAAMPAVLDKIRTWPGRIVCTRDTHDSGYLNTQEGHNLPVPHCLAGTSGWEFEGELATMQREANWPVYLKGTFGSPELARDLEAARARGELSSVELIGFCTDICVVSNAMLLKAQMPGVPISVDASCCAGITPEKHQAALETLASCQIAVM